MIHKRKNQPFIRAFINPKLGETIIVSSNAYDKLYQRLLVFLWTFSGNRVGHSMIL